ncbi:hypothetical protein FVE85_6514 [Porphyridium purpureum]|uniref:Uncharacterized protein n=1 Tax=Porphyridium purpureum TaxID=35688 RepID=A0A5J4Z4K5_PORPP|nr:hypothetical protein FVE85_6514 [Porphyridium purpureum]|eukprot:POR5324..scf295_1
MSEHRSIQSDKHASTMETRRARAYDAAAFMPGGVSAPRQFRIHLPQDRKESVLASLRSPARAQHARLLRARCLGFRPQKSRMRMAAGGGDEDQAKCVDVIEDAFLTACMPGNKPYVDALKEFIAAVLQAYQAGFGLNPILFELQSRQGSSKRRLQPDELEFRTVWITIVYKTLRHMNVPRDTSVSQEIVGLPDSFDTFVASVYKAVKNGYDLKRIQLEQSMANPNGQSRNDFESAVLLQSTRIVFYTIELAQ